MKKINVLWVLLLCLLAACSEDSVDALSGKYAMNRYVFDSAVQKPTEKLSKGIKALVMTLTDGTDSLAISFGSSEWVLAEGVYTPVTSVADKNQCFAVLNKEQVVVSGNLEVALPKENTYYISGLLTDADGTRFKVNYKGTLSFEVGEDDPEASGYTAILSTSAVTVYDANWQPVVYPDVTKYTFMLTDPDGNDVGSFDAINVNNAEATSLVGTYTIQGNSTTPWLMDNGWVVPDYNMAGGSYYVNAGVKQYITGGTVTISAVEGVEGDMLYSFTGTGLTTTTAAGVSGTGSFSIKFATLLQSTGIELRDQTINSAVLGREMKYSVCLPKGYDGTKTYPVLYMLHGYNGGNNDWLIGGMFNPYLSSAVAAGTAPEMIVVCPDGMNSFYCNGFQNGMQYMTYFFDEFIPFIESTYKVKSERSSRAIGGLSMGGFGSLYYGLLHPEMFCCVYACSPAAYVEGAPNLYEMMATTKPAEMPGITIETGTEDTVVGAGPSYLYGAMTQAGIACEYIARPGVHDWAFWKACTPKIVAKVGSVLQ